MSSNELPNTKQVNRRKTTPPALLCLEGEWDPDPFDMVSVGHSLQLSELPRYLRLVPSNLRGAGYPNGSQIGRASCPSNAK